MNDGCFKSAEILCKLGSGSYRVTAKAQSLVFYHPPSFVRVQRAQPVPQAFWRAMEMDQWKRPSKLCGRRAECQAQVLRTVMVVVNSPVEVVYVSPCGKPPPSSRSDTPCIANLQGSSLMVCDLQCSFESLISAWWNHHLTVATHIHTHALCLQDYSLKTNEKWVCE